MPPPHEPLPEHIGSCSSCGSRLAVDQRWCVDCGTRRGPMSPAMRALIAGTIPESFVAAAAPEPTAVRAPARPILGLPSPRAAAVAVSAVLAFGVIVGSVVSPAAIGQGQAPIVVAMSAPPAGPPPAAPVAEEAPVDD
ncbi:MAG TPA: hypothetical protein VF066_11645, partial [Thermoleophilaceae bacterium]